MGKKLNTTPTDFKKELGVSVRELRKKHRLTQAAFADILGLNHSCISRYESGRDDISIYTFQQFCKALGDEMMIYITKNGIEVTISAEVSAGEAFNIAKKNDN